MPSTADLLDRLVEACPAPVIVSDLKGRILVFNPAAEAALGYRSAEARSHLHVTDLYHRAEEARRVLQRLRAADATSGRDPIEVTLRARNGELVPVRLTASLVHDDSGAPVASLGVFEDRRESIALGRRLEDAADLVMASEQRLAGMAAAGAVAHEIAQPLTAAMGNLEMLLMHEALPQRVMDRLGRTWNQLERLGRIVHAFTRIAEARGAARPSEDDEE